MKAIFALTSAYVIAIAIAVSSSDSTIGIVLIGEAVFALPMIIGCGLASIIRQENARLILLVFEIGFSIFSLLIFIVTFTGEHDAQYQLALLIVALVGFPSVVISGAVAAFWPTNKQSN